jgi:predicted phosphodiesterase
MSFAAFTDTHIGAKIETSWQMADHLDSMCQDIMNNTLPCDFTVHLGDIIMHSSAYVEGEQLPLSYDQYYNNFKAYMLQHINMPFMAVSGNHDLCDYYGQDHSGYPNNNGKPYNLVRKLIDSMEMNSYPYAFMKNNILFIALPETDYHMYTKPIIYEYVKYMTLAYPENTTIILSHQAIEDTTIHDGSANTYRAKQDRKWWAQLFRDNPQVKMWIHGHQHMLDWYQSDHSTGLTYPVEHFGHEMVFSIPYSQADWGDYHEEDRMVIYTVNKNAITTKAWENNGLGGNWIPDYDHTFNVETTYNEAAQDWYSIPIFMQDGEIQLTDMKVFSPNMELEFIGTTPMELFYDPNMATEGTSWGGENLLGFGDDEYASVTANVPGMTVTGPADVDFPPKYSGADFQGGSSAYHEDGRTGQPYHYFPVGTTHAAVPEASYDVTMTARSASGTGRVNLTMSASDHGSATQYSTLAGSEQLVFSHTFGSAYETVTGTYTVPADDNAWFLQGVMDFVDSTSYDVSYFSIKRTRDSNTTDNFELIINGNSFRQLGSLDRYEKVTFDVDPVTLTNSNGVLELTANIEGNHFGMARLIHYAPVLMGRNASFDVNSISGNAFDITLTNDLSYYSDTFKMFPLSPKYGPLNVTGHPSAVINVSTNGNEWIQADTPNDDIDLTITYGPATTFIANESPYDGQINVELDTELSAYLYHLQNAPIIWEIWSDVSGSWQLVADGNLSGGSGNIAASVAGMDQYSSPYNWMVRATDTVSGVWVEKNFTFTTQPDTPPGPAIKWWAIADPHIQTDLPGYRSLENALRDSKYGGDQGGESFEFDFATAAGDWTGNQQCPGDNDGLDIIDQWNGAGEDPSRFYGVIGNHDAGETDNAWFEKWVDPLGQNTAFSMIDNNQRPYPVQGQDDLRQKRRTASIWTTMFRRLSGW